MSLEMCREITENSHVGEEMVGLVVDFLTTVHTVHFDRFPGPSEHAREQFHGNGRQRLMEVFLQQISDDFVFLAFGPASDGPLHIDSLHVDETLRAQLVGEFVAGSRVDPDFGSRIVHVVSPLDESAVGLIVAFQAMARELTFLRLDPAAGFEMIPRLLEQSWPVVDTQHEHTHMNVVESVVVGPVGFGIVDDELTVGWNEAGLDGRQICSDHRFLGEGIGELDGPDT